MPLNIQQFKAVNPDFADLPDADVFDYLHQTYYSDIPAENLATAINFKLPTVEVEDKPWTNDLGEAGNAFARGMLGGVNTMAGQALQTFSEPGGMIHRYGKFAEDYGQRYEQEHPADMEGRGLGAQALIAGAEAAPASLLTVGASALPVVGPVVGPALTVGLFGGSQREVTKRKALAEGKSEEEANTLGFVTGAINGVGEVLDNYLSLGMFGIGKKALGGAVEAALSKATDASILKPFVKEGFKNLAGQLTSEEIQNVSTEAVERQAGIGTGQSYGDITKQSMLAVGGLTGIFSVLGLPVHVANSARMQQVNNLLDNPKADPDQRALAVAELHKQFKAANVPDADAWVLKASRAIDANQPVPRSGDFSVADIEQSQSVDEAIVQFNAANNAPLETSQPTAEDLTPPIPVETTSAPATGYDEIFNQASVQHGVPVEILKAFNMVEAGGRLTDNGETIRPRDKNGKLLSNAVGPMQIIGHYFPKFDPDRLAKDPQYNVNAAAQILQGYYANTPERLTDMQRWKLVARRYFGSTDPMANKAYADKIVAAIGKEPVNKEFGGNYEGSRAEYEPDAGLVSNTGGSTVSLGDRDSEGFEDNAEDAELSDDNNTLPGAIPLTEQLTESVFKGLPIQEIPLINIKLSKDVPQFKSGANKKGVVEPITGSFERTGVAPIQLWERENGDIELISGRHRLDLAQRSGEESIPSQIHREADGFTKQQAATMDAELNIRDGQGTARDYVSYFKNSGITREQAEERGLVGRQLGRRAFTIAENGTDDLIAAHRNASIDDEQAYRIALTAPKNPAVQAIGIKAAMEGKNPVNLMSAVLLKRQETGAEATTDDLFGFDDSAMRDAEAMAKVATDEQTRLKQLRAAAKVGAKAADVQGLTGGQVSVLIKDKAHLKKYINELDSKIGAWNNWSTNPELVKYINQQLKPETTAVEQPVVKNIKVAPIEELASYEYKPNISIADIDVGDTISSSGGRKVAGFDGVIKNKYRTKFDIETTYMGKPMLLKGKTMKDFEGDVTLKKGSVVYITNKEKVDKLKGESNAPIENRPDTTTKTPLVEPINTSPDTSVVAKTNVSGQPAQIAKPNVVIVNGRKVPAKLAAKKAQKEASLSELENVTDIPFKNVTARYNNNAGVDLIDTATGKRLFPEKSFKTPQEAKKFFKETQANQLEGAQPGVRKEGEQNEEPLLTSYTEDELEAQEAKIKSQEKSEQEANLKAENKRKVDTLADEMFGNIGQQDIQDLGEKIGGARKDTSNKTETGTAIYERQEDLFDEEQTISKTETKNTDAGWRQDALQKPQIINAKTGQFKVGLTHVNSPADALHVISSISDYAQEQMLAVVLDKKNKLIQVIKHTSGLTASSQVDPGMLAGSILDIPQADSVYFAHNHPSGYSGQSREDKNITNRLRDILEPTGIKTNGMLVTVTGTKGTFSDGAFEADIHETKAERNKSINVTERKIARNTKLHDEKITSPADAVRIAKEVADGNSGVLLLDTQNQPVSFVEMLPADMLALRPGGRVSEAALLLREIHATNARGMMGVIPTTPPNGAGTYTEQYRNLKAFAYDTGALTNVVDFVVGNVTLKGVGIDPLTEGKPYWSMNAWHGSPYDHERFDISKVGSGEGARAFGYGHYFTDKKEIAEFYRDKLSHRKLSTVYMDGNELTDDKRNKLPDYEYDALTAYMAFDGDVSKTRTQLDDTKHKFRTGQEALDWFNANVGRLSVKINQGKLYNVELAPEADEYLDWDKPLSEQSEKVKRALKDSSINYPDKEWNTGQKIYYQSAPKGSYASSAEHDGVASDYLHSLGIRGIRYKAEAGRGDAYNYVIFSDDDVRIVNKYSQRDKTHAASLSVAQATKMIPKYVRPMLAKNKLVVLDKPGDLPAVVTERIEEAPDNDAPTGLYDPLHDVIYLFAGNLSAAEFNGALSHELLHRAFRSDIRLMKAFSDFTSSIKARMELASKGHASAIENKAYKRVMESKTDPRLYEDEFVAYIVSEYQKNPKSLTGAILRAIKNFISAMRVALIRSGMTYGFVKTLTPSDLLVMSRYGANAELGGPVALLKQFGLMKSSRYDVAVGQEWKTGLDTSGQGRDIAKNVPVQDKRMRDNIDDGYRPKGIFKKSLLSMWAKSAGSNLPDETNLQKFQRTWQDNFNRFKVIQETKEIEEAKAGGFTGDGLYEARMYMKLNGIKNPIRDETNVYQAQSTLSGIITEAIKDFDVKTVKPLVKEAQKAGITMDDISTFLKMQHAEEANARIRKIKPNQPDATAYGVTDKEAQDALNEFKKRADYGALKNISDKWRNLTDDILNLKVAEGLIPQKQVDVYHATFNLYVPVKGAEDESKAQGTGKGLSAVNIEKRRLGHGEREERIIENILKDYERTLTLVEKNKLGKIAGAFIKEVDDPEIGTVGKPVRRQIFRPGATHYMVQYHGSDVQPFDNLNDARRFVEAESLKAGRKKSDFYIDRTKDDGRVILQAKPLLEDNEFQYYVNGAAIRAQWNDELLARAYKNLGAEQTNKILEGARQINVGLSKAYTGWSPTFLIKNPIRDAIQGAITLTSKLGAGQTAKIFKAYPHAAKQLFNHFKEHGSSAEVNLYRRSGGSTGAAYLSDTERIGNDIMDAYNEYAGAVDTYNRTYADAIKEGKSETAARLKASGKAAKAGFMEIPVIGHFLKFMESANGVTENALRLATFNTLIAEKDANGNNLYSYKQAAAYAKDLMNFNRKGELTTQAGALYLFFNPNAQGTQVLLSALTEGPHKRQAQALSGMIALSAFIAAEAMRSGSDDDERKWRAIPDGMKDRNLIFGSGKTKIMMPVPYGFGVFHSLGNAMSDMAHGQSTWKASIRMTASMFDNFSPFGNPITSEKGAFQMLPTLPKMVMSPGVNENNFGTPIQPMKYNEAKPDSSNMYRGTKGTYYADLAQLMNNLSGGNKYKAGLVDVSPETLRFWVSSLTGGTGQFVIDSLNSTKILAQGVAPDTYNIPIVRAFTHETGVSDSRQAFWKAKEDTDKAVEEFRAAKRAGDTAAMIAIKKNNASMLALAKVATKQQQSAKALRDAIDVIRLNDNMSLAEKQKKIKALELKEAETYDKFLNLFYR